jgi:hypothetical protein
MIDLEGREKLFCQFYNSFPVTLVVTCSGVQFIASAASTACLWRKKGLARWWLVSPPFQHAFLISSLFHKNHFTLFSGAHSTENVYICMHARIGVSSCNFACSYNRNNSYISHDHIMYKKTLHSPLDTSFLHSNSRPNFATTVAQTSLSSNAQTQSLEISLLNLRCTMVLDTCKSFLGSWMPIESFFGWVWRGWGGSGELLRGSLIFQDTVIVSTVLEMLCRGHVSLFERSLF